MKRYAKLFPLILFLAALYLRFYKLSNWFFFNVDEDWFLYIVRKLVVFKQPLLVGWEMPGGLLTTPVMYYVGGLLMWVGKNDPVALAVHAAFVSVVTVVMVFVVGRELFGYRIGVISSFIFCISYLVNIYSRLTLSVYLGPLLSLLLYLTLVKVKQKKSSIWLLLLAVVFIFSTQEGSLVSLIILGFGCLLYLIRQLNKKLLTISLCLFFLSFTPLAIFDLRHEFLATKRVVHFISFKKEGEKNNSSLLDAGTSNFYNFGSSFVRVFFPTGDADINKQILPCQDYIAGKEANTPLLFGIVGITILFLFVLKSLGSRQSTIGQKIISWHLIVVSSGLVLFSLLMPRHQHEWFYVVLFPAYVYIAAYICERLWQLQKPLPRILLICFIGVFVFVNLKKTFTGTAVVGYQDKLDAVQFIRPYLQGKTFDLTYLGNGCNAYGYRYLFTYIGVEPSSAYTDSTYSGWLYPKPENASSSYKVILIPLPDLRDEDKTQYLYFKSRALHIFKENNLEVLIVPNL